MIKNLPQMTKGLVYQWKNFLNWLHFKIFLKKKYRKLVNQSNDLVKKIKKQKEIINKDEQLINEKIASLENKYNTDKSLNLYLQHKQMKIPLIEKIKDFFKFRLNLNLKYTDGYIFYANIADEFSILKVSGLDYLWKRKNKELYNISEKIGTFRGKPAFFIKYPFAISLNINDDNKLYYDAKTYYNYIEKAVKPKMTNLPSEKFDIINFIKTNLILVIILIILVFLFFTDEGKIMLKDMMNK